MTLKPLALLDFNAGQENRGAGNVRRAAESLGYNVVSYEMRLSKPKILVDRHDMYVATGGPGDPRDEGDWAPYYYDVLDEIDARNKAGRDDPKRRFLICHSFQMAAAYWGIAALSPRDSGQLLSGLHVQELRPEILAHPPHPCLQGLPPRMRTLENRFHQACQIAEHPDYDVFAERGDPEHKAITGIVGKDGLTVGIQFHPESNVPDVAEFLQRRRDTLITLNGQAAYDRMVENVAEIAVPHKMFVDFLRSGLQPA